MEKLDLIAGATIALDKPLTWSSFSLVNKFRCEACRYLGIKKLKVGHAGTPAATARQKPSAAVAMVFHGFFGGGADRAVCKSAWKVKKRLV